MNPHLLLRHFPELQDLPPERREAILRQAHERAYAPERKLEHWRGNVFSLVWITALALFLVLVVGPALSLSRPVVGAVIMVVVLPLFMYQRHRQYLAKLRPEVRRLIDQKSES